jgi:hypothetical protein
MLGCSPAMDRAARLHLAEPPEPHLERRERHLDRLVAHGVRGSSGSCVLDHSDVAGPLKVTTCEKSATQTSSSPSTADCITPKLRRIRRELNRDGHLIGRPQDDAVGFSQTDPQVGCA